MAYQTGLELREKHYSHKANTILNLKEGEKLSHFGQVKDKKLKIF